MSETNRSDADGRRVLIPEFMVNDEYVAPLKLDLAISVVSAGDSGDWNLPRETSSDAQARPNLKPSLDVRPSRAEMISR